MRRRPAIKTNALTTRRRASAGRLAKNSPNASKCPPPRGNEQIASPPSWTRTPQPRGYVAERPAQRSLVGQYACNGNANCIASNLGRGDEPGLGRRFCGRNAGRIWIAARPRPPPVAQAQAARLVLE